jgi:predicted nucleotidyltransferase
MMDKWFNMLNEARDKRPRREPTPFKSKAQKRYKAQRRKNDIYSTVAGHKNLSTGAPFSTKVKRAGTDRLRFEEVDPETFEKQSELNPKLWQGDKLNKNISKRLLKIARQFINELNLPIHHEESAFALVEDVRLTGSMANYNWSKYSDIDVHILIDFSKIDDNMELIRSLFDNAGARWNDLHDIMIYGYEVEIYVEDLKNATAPSGLYSIVRDIWITEPDPERIDFDYTTARKKADSIETQTNLIEKFAIDKPQAALKSVKRLKDKIRRMRMAGLHSPDQEYSVENVAFKILRREETIEKLNNIKYDTYDRILSIG